MTDTLSKNIRALTLYDLQNGVHEQLADEVAALEQRVEGLELSEANLKLANDEARKTIDRLSALVPKEANDAGEA